MSHFAAPYLRHAVLAAMLATASLVVNAQQVVTLKFAHFLSSNSTFQKKVAEPWCAAIEADSKGRLKCQIFPSLQLGGTPQQLVDQAQHGIADIVWTNPSYTTGRFPRMEALELPMTVPADGLGGSRVMWEYTQKYAMADFKDFKVLAVFSGTNLIFNTAKKPIAASSDFKGLKLRSPSRFASLFLSALGATPLNMPVAQVSEGISKGIIDGAMATWEVLPATKLDEVTQYHLEGKPQQPAFSQPVLAILMNKDRYEVLSPELKAVIDKHSGTPLVENAGRAWDLDNQAARKKILEMGHSVQTISSDDLSAMKKAAESVEKEWIKQATARGLNGAELAAELHTVAKRHMPN